MTAFKPLPVPAPIQCAWCTYQPGDSTDARILPWLAQVLGHAVETLDISRDARGRPHLNGGHNVDVNWSHSGQVLLAALGVGIRVGADIEWQRPRRRNALALAERFFAPAEAAQLRELPESGREIAFTRLWCAKEAVLKAYGHGISYGLDRLVFALDGESCRLLHCEGGLGSAQEWAVHSFSPLPGYLAALAWREG